MDAKNKIIPTPWDERAFDMPTFEVLQYGPETLSIAAQTPGHYTIKVHPLSPKALLHEYGFYYCDTLIETFCNAGSFVDHRHDQATISKDIDISLALGTAIEAFSHGRFHRDFNLPVELAHKRYALWLTDLIQTGEVYALIFETRQVGFVACRGPHLALHAIDSKNRNKGIAKYLWSKVCRELFSRDYKEITSSISASNVVAMNLYTSLGFRFRNPKDIYHKLVK